MQPGHPRFALARRADPAHDAVLSWSGDDPMRGGLRVALPAALLIALAVTAGAAPVPPPVWQDAPTPGQRESLPLAPGELEAARAAFERLHDAEPQATGPFIGLATIALREGNLVAAEDWLRKGIAVRPADPQLHRALGRVHAAEGKTEMAVADFNEAIRLAPDLAAARLEIADLLRGRLDQPAKALPFYDAVLERDPGNGVARYGRGLALAGIGERARALAELNEAATLLPDSPLPDYARARVLGEAGQKAEAMDALDAALGRQSGFIPARLARAALLQQAGRGGEALAAWDSVLRQDPGSIPALLGVGMALQSGGQVAGAAARYRTVLAVAPDNAIALNNLAWIGAEERHGLDEALARARRAVAADPDNAAFADTLGWVLYRQGDLAGAEQALARAAALKPDAGTLTRLARVRGQMGRVGEATADAEQALTLEPGYAPAREELERLRARRP